MVLHRTNHQEIFSSKRAAAFDAALKRFTSLFGMGRGGATSHKLPENVYLQLLMFNCIILLASQKDFSSSTSLTP